MWSLFLLASLAGAHTLDLDGDGYASDVDCNDAHPFVHPGAEELPADGVDQNCDRVELCYADEDGDGYGWGTLSDNDLDCDNDSAPTASRSGDCEDTDPERHPDGVETCNGQDDNCDDLVDNDAIDALDGFRDRDLDGFGDPAVPLHGCASPHLSDQDGDCDDTRVSVHPDAREVCDEIDNDCDGIVDNDAFQTPIWARDADGDGDVDYSDTIKTCTQPEGYILANGSSEDCDDGNPKIGRCGGCSTMTGGSFHVALLALLLLSTRRAEAHDLDDLDGDGVASEIDCNDHNPYVYPGAIEIPFDGIDQDCDGVDMCFADLDGDGFGGVQTPDDDLDCANGTGSVTHLAGDCDDSNPNIRPFAEEQCNGVDDDCNGWLDDDAVDAMTAFADEDRDGYGDDDSERITCTLDIHEVQQGGDCDDTDQNRSPGTLEICDGLDNDCDGDVDGDADDASEWFHDWDRDGYGAPGTMEVSCEPPEEDPPVWARNDKDCDDWNARIAVCDSGCNTSGAPSPWWLAILFGLTARRSRR